MEHYPITLTLNKTNYRLRKGQKPPKMRFKIGDRFQQGDEVYHIFAAFRTVDKPNEWIYYMENEVSEKHRRLDEMCETIMTLEGHQKPPSTIVYDLFYNSHDAMDYFSNISIRGTSRMARRNSDVIKMKKL